MKTLYLEYYTPQHGGQICTERHQELMQALHHNLTRPVVDRMVVFTEEPLEVEPHFPVDFVRVQAPRMTFQRVFDYANERTGPDDIHILCNSDIALVRGFEQLEERMSSDDFFCVSRHELDGKLIVHAHGSQDTWIWKGHNRIRNANFHMGIRGCDCHLIGAARRAHYEVSNPSKDLITLHHHGSNLRNSQYHEHFVPGPWLGVEPCRIGEIGEVCQFISSGNWPKINTPTNRSRSHLKRLALAAFS